MGVCRKLGCGNCGVYNEGGYFVSDSSLMVCVFFGCYRVRVEELGSLGKWRGGARSIPGGVHLVPDIRRIGHEATARKEDITDLLFQDTNLGPRGSEATA